MAAEHKTKHLQLVQGLLAWFSVHARALPWRRTTDPYAVWVSEIMLQQTQVKTVIPYWERWMSELPTIQSLADASSDKIHKLWEGLGYYTRVRNMQKAAQFLVQTNDGNFPSDYEAILNLPGIGRYTAGAISSIAFNQPTPILDGNVTRVLARTFGIAGNPREKPTNAQLWQLAGELVSRAHDSAPQKSKTKKPSSSRHCSDFNQSLMELGALICTPRDPKCSLCPLREICVAYRDGRVMELPNLGTRVQATERRFAAFVVEKRGKYLVRQRPTGVVNAHLWEFPNIEVLDPKENLRELAKPFLIAADAQPACRIKHSITRYRVTLEAYPAALAAGSIVSESIGVWRTTEELQSLAFTGAHRKLVAAVIVRGNT